MRLTVVGMADMTLERFRSLMDQHSDLGDWKVRAITNPYPDVLIATLRGPNGRVEVWDGTLHRQEIWFIGKDKSETFIAKECGYRCGELREAILQACALAGIQMRLVV